MKVGEICNREVIIARKEESLLEAGKRMREFHVGSLVVIQESEGERIPIGILTDRDILMEVLSEGVPLEKIEVRDIMSSSPVTVSQEEGVFETIDLMRRHGIRRVPVVDAQRSLVGVLALDDLLEFLSEELKSLSKIFSFQQEQEALHRP